MPIDAAKKNILVEEVLIQCALALSHFEQAVSLLIDIQTRQSRFVWAHLHAFLAHAAMVSKMLASPSKTAMAKSSTTLAVFFGSGVFGIPGTRIA